MFIMRFLLFPLFFFFPLNASEELVTKLKDAQPQDFGHFKDLVRQPCAVTYAFSQGRFGDHLMAYLHALWISHKYSIPLLYKPFSYSEKMALHTHHTRYETFNLEKYDVVRIWREQDLLSTLKQRNTSQKAILFELGYFPESRWERARIGWPYVAVDWTDPIFRSLAQKAIAPLGPLTTIEVPKDRITVALHARKGGGYDNAEAFQAFPMKLPSDDFYLDQLVKIDEIFQHKPFYVHLFTDDPNPKELAKYYQKALNLPYVTFGYRETDNRHDANVMEDFYSLMKCDCIICPQSHFSITNALVTDYKVAIFPENWNHEKQKIDRVEIRISKDFELPPKRIQMVEREGYLFSDEPIDVVIPCTSKDLNTLEMCIAGIKSCCPQIRRIIVISAEKLTNKAEWFNENKFPFSKVDIVNTMTNNTSPEDHSNLENIRSRSGWYFQQLLKFYTHKVIPGISSNILNLDSDTIFLKPVTFINSELQGLYHPGWDYHPPYFEHARKLLPGFEKKFPQYSGIAHHMLFQKCILEDLFHNVEKIHKKEFWKIFCECVDNRHSSGASEYEIYFNFMLSKTKNFQIRPLKMLETPHLHLIPEYKTEEYDYVSCHAWMRGEN